MSRFSRWVKLVAFCFVAVVTAGSARAAVVINFSEVGPDIVATVSGSLSNLSPASFGSDIIQNSFWQNTGANVFQISTAGGTRQIYTMTRTSGPSTTWSTMTSYLGVTTIDVSLSGLSKFGMIANAATGKGQIDLIGYTAGATITGQSKLSGKTLAGLQLPTSFTEFVYTLDNGGDTVTVQFGSPSGGGGAVPEPTSLAIFGLGAIGAAIRARRFRVQATG